MYYHISVLCNAKYFKRVTYCPNPGFITLRLCSFNSSKNVSTFRIACRRRGVFFISSAVPGYYRGRIDQIIFIVQSYGLEQNLSYVTNVLGPINSGFSLKVKAFKLYNTNLPTIMRMIIDYALQQTHSYVLIGNLSSVSNLKASFIGVEIMKSSVQFINMIWSLNKKSVKIIICDVRLVR